MSNLDHLKESIREVTSTGTVADRLAILNAEIFVRHSIAEAGLLELQDLYRYERGIRANAAAVIGEPGSGKSQLGQAFKRDIFALTKEDGAAPSEVTIIEPSWDGDPMRLLVDVAQGLNVGLRADASRLFKDIVDYVRDANLAAIVLEDLHDLFHYSTHSISKSKWDRNVAQSLKYVRRLINETRILHIFTTLPSGMRDVITDPQFNDRIQCKVYLPPWRGSPAETIIFLDALEKELPLRHPSMLSQSTIRNWLVKNTNSTRVMVQVVRDTTREAILDGSERLTLPMLKKRYPTVPMTPDAGKAAATRRKRDTPTASEKGASQQGGKA
ncbi:MAG: TniB family NTP-binding protein [Sulfuricaulis sp.]